MEEEDIHLDPYMNQFFSIFYLPSILIEEKYILIGDDSRFIRRLTNHIKKIKEKHTKYLSDMMRFHHLMLCEAKDYKRMKYEFKWMKKYYDILEVIRRRDSARNRYFSLHPYNIDYLVERGFINE